MFDVKPITSLKHSDCGPTCLQMLLSYYGIDVDLETLSKECHVTITGCSAKDIMQAGRLHGLDMTAWGESGKFSTDDTQEKKTLDVSILEQDRPAIVWWKYSHWCVFCGLDDDGKVVICNPDRGRYPISVGTFKSFFSGVSLCNGVPEVLPEQTKEE